jgi:hypothetical protein
MEIPLPVILLVTLLLEIEGDLIKPFLIFRPR